MQRPCAWNISTGTVHDVDIVTVITASILCISEVLGNLDLANMSMPEIEKFVMNMKNSKDPLSQARMFQLERKVGNHSPLNTGAPLLRIIDT